MWLVLSAVGDLVSIFGRGIRHSQFGKKRDCAYNDAYTCGIIASDLNVSSNSDRASVSWTL